MNTTNLLTEEVEIINYILIAATTTIIFICIFWIWYYIVSVFRNKREEKSVNQSEAINTMSRVQDLRAQRTKNYLFISILSFEMLRKLFALMEYFYVTNLDQRYHTITIHSNEKECPADLHEAIMKPPILVFMQSINMTSTLCLISLVGITMLYLAKMYTRDKKMRSIHALVIILAIKAVLVLILSSTVFLHVAGWFVWLLCIAFDWFLILVFAIKLNNALSTYKSNYDIPVELKLNTHKTTRREYRVIKCVSILITVCTLIYVVAIFLGTTIGIADIVILYPCFFRAIGIWVANSTPREMIEFIRIREEMIFSVYVMTAFFDATIIITHFFFLIKHRKKVFETIICRQQKQVFNYDKNVLEEPLLNDTQVWTDETFVKKLEGSSIS